MASTREDIDHDLTSADDNTMHAQGTMSRDGGPWENDLELTHQRLEG
jgi:hypothetical protein